MLKLWQRSLFIAGVFSILVVPSALAEAATKSKKLLFATIYRVNDLSRPAMTVQGKLSQRETVVSVMAVKANPTDKGVEVILQTSLGQQLQITNRSAGNNFIADIPNAQLRLPSGEAFTFRSEKPLAGITEITVTNQDANTIRVTIIGEASVPTVNCLTVRKKV